MTNPLPMYGIPNTAMPMQAPYYPQEPALVYGTGQNMMGPSVPQTLNDPVLKEIIAAQEKANIDSMKESQKAIIKIREKREIEEIKDIIREVLKVEVKFDSPKKGLHGIKKSLSRDIDK